MLETTLEVQEYYLKRDSLAETIAERWDSMNSQRQGWLNEKQELRNYVFATDTTTTSNSDLPWKNKTTLPKLCQLRDNLHANYISALLPNDNWLKWEGYTRQDNESDKRDAIQAYISNKAREGDMRTTLSKLLYDYIDYGIAIADVIWVNEHKEDAETGERIPGFIGPKLIRVSPLDVVFDPTSESFEFSWKVTRSIKRYGEFKLEMEQNPQEWIGEVIGEIEDRRTRLGSFTRDDFRKAEAFSVDGFGDLYEYYGSGFVELLEFEGTIHDIDSGEMLSDYIITIVDRKTVVRKQRIPAWKRGGMKVMSSWRKRPDNLYGMGPLDNLVGMQYRIDHLENLKADVGDLIVAPPVKVIGDVEEFTWQPFEQIVISEGGDVQAIQLPAQVFQANNEILQYLQLMEELAGAPRQAMGIRTPGEKTAFEVQTLENAAGRIFQEKVEQFEIELLEPALNNMLMVAVKNMVASDLIRVMDDDFGVVQFLQITKKDITANGKLRPIGARHFSSRAQIIQNLTQLSQSNLWPKIEPHVGDKALASLVESTLQLERFSLVSDNAGLMDKVESQRLMNQAAEDLETEAATPLDEEEVSE